MESKVDEFLDKIRAAHEDSGGTTGRLKFHEQIVGWLVIILFFGIPTFIVWQITPDSIRYPIFYALLYQIDYQSVSVEKQPTDCDFWDAPLGDKGCHYTKEVLTYRDKHGRVTTVDVAWLKESN